MDVRVSTLPSSTVAEPIEAPDRAVLIRLDEVPPSDPEKRYDRVRKSWKVGESRRRPGPQAPDYALAVHAGIVYDAYAIDGWTRSDGGGKWAFVGHPCPEVARRYIGRDVSAYLPRGARFPLGYVHCEGTPGRRRGPLSATLNGNAPIRSGRTGHIQEAFCPRYGLSLSLTGECSERDLQW